MHAAILGLFRDPVDADAVELETETNRDDRGITVEQYEYLDGATIYTGTAAGYHEVQEQDISVTETAIFTEPVESREHVAAEYYADFDAGWVGIETGKAEFIWDRLGALAGTECARAEIDLDAFAHDYENREDAHVWQVGRSTPDDSEDDGEGAVISYHDDARLQDATTRDSVSQIGVSYRWGRDQYVRGTIAASGYVAIYSSSMTVESFGRWLRDELLPYASLPDTGQSFLQEATSDDEKDEDVEECERCGRDPEGGLHEHAGEQLCIVCKDKAEEESTGFEILDSVTVADGGRDE